MMNISAVALEGLEGAQEQFNRAASKLFTAASPTSPTADQTDLSQAAVGLLAAKNDFEGNLKVLKVADQMERSTIDMLA
jgi:flagellar basal body rod protein FlgC